MAIEFKLPEIGEGTAEGEIIKWLVAVGDEVAEDTPLVEVMTDKATVEVPSPRAGTIQEIQAQEGEIVDVGAVIMLFAGDGDAAATSPPAAPMPSSPETPEPTDADIAAARAMARAELGQPAAPTNSWEAPAPVASRVLATPATRALARELTVDLSAITGSGKGGRVMREDVEAFASGAAAATATSATTLAASNTAVAAVAASVAVAAVPELEDRVAFRGMRRRIAEKMVQAKTVIPHFTYVEECDMTEVVALRQQAKAIGATKGVKVTFLPFIVQAMVAALKDNPILNSTLDEEAEEIVIKRTINVGIATATERGLIVPVVKDADRLGIFDLAREIDRVAGEARAGKSQLADLQGGTITITSTGSLGGLLSTPIINHPEVAIIGVTAIRQRPMVRAGEIVIRDMLNLSLSLDHRMVDGYDGAVFLRQMIAYLEDPKLLLLGTP